MNAPCSELSAVLSVHATSVSVPARPVHGDRVVAAVGLEPVVGSGDQPDGAEERHVIGGDRRAGRQHEQRDQRLRVPEPAVVVEVGPELGEQRSREARLQLHDRGQAGERGGRQPREQRVHGEPAATLAAGHPELLGGRVQHDPHVGRHDEHPSEGRQETELRGERRRQARQPVARRHGPQGHGQVARVADQQAGRQAGQVLFGQVLWLGRAAATPAAPEQREMGDQRCDRHARSGHARVRQVHGVRRLFVRPEQPFHVVGAHPQQGRGARRGHRRPDFRHVPDAFLVHVHVRRLVVHGPVVVLAPAERHVRHARPRKLVPDHVPALGRRHVVNLVRGARDPSRSGRPDREQRPEADRRFQRRRRRFAHQVPRGQAVAPGAVGVPEHAHVLATGRPVLEHGVRVRRASSGRGGRRAVRTSVHDLGGSLADAGPQRRSARRPVVVGRSLDPEAACEQSPVGVVGVVPLAVPVQQRVVGRVLQPNADRRPAVVSGTVEQRFPVDHLSAFAVAPSAPDVLISVPIAGRLHGVSGHKIVGPPFALVANLVIHHRVPRTPADHQRSSSVRAVHVVTPVPGVVVRASGDGHDLIRFRVELTVPTTVAVQFAVRVVVTVRQRLAVVFERFSTYQFRVGPIRTEKS
ncbi:hypothetical protein AGLY_002965 [Aphis glycines]|uniref:Uncharacterized protein n=1 Tax=Aphis glycines TaxID=307491 RepID=A0A6G0U1V5_APHGL|nr:hypothetical protein AGLY_002965 [Aphis glycines]